MSQPARVGLRGHPVTARVTSKRSRDIETKARELLVGHVVKDVAVTDDQIKIWVSGGGEFTMMMDTLTEIQ